MDANQQAVTDYLEEMKERALKAHSKGNRFGSMYLSMIAGMWNHTARRPSKPNLFEGENNDLYAAYLWGNDASADAMRSNEREMAIRKKIEEAKLKAAKKKVDIRIKNPYATLNEKKQTTSIWKKKLW